MITSFMVLIYQSYMQSIEKVDFVPIARIQKGFTGVVAFEQRSLFSG